MRALPLPAAGEGWRVARWPLTALATWLVAWAIHLALRPAGPLAAVLLPALAAAAASAVLVATPWRRAIVAVGFPLSLLATGAVSSWLWLLPLGALALVYPMGAWRDAPLFPTPPGTLDGLGAALPMADGARILDAGCGTGDALVALAREYPRAALHGIERSVPVAMLARLRLGRRASIARGDLWAHDWSGFDLVYVFQRPESMPRVAEKARSQLRVGAWLASLEFPIPGAAAAATHRRGDGKTLYLYGPGPTGRAKAVSPRPARRR